MAGIPAPVQPLDDDRLHRAGVMLALKRDDLIDPDLPGNKWRKLRLNLAAARDGGYRRLLTFGGAYSNHLRAVAAAGQRYGLETVGVVRGEELRSKPLNPSLCYAQERGMLLTYLDRAIYRRKSEPGVLAALRAQWGDCYLLPEGGSNELAVRGCVEIPRESPDFDVICCPVATGGTLAGIAAGLTQTQSAYGFSALKGGKFLEAEVESLQQRTYGARRGQWHLETGYHFGGYARRTADLDSFIDDFRARHAVSLDWIYVAKMMYGIFDLAAQRRFAVGTRLRAVITGPADPLQAGKTLR